MNPFQFHRHKQGSDEHPKKRLDFFTGFANKTARLAGSHYSFTLAVLVILVWGITGPLFQFSDTWQLVINTSTTIITFLMVFLIQNTQNRDSQALHLKMDALIVANRRARNILVEMEDMSQEELDRIKAKFTELADKETQELERDNWEQWIFELTQDSSIESRGS